ncbi:hypothetical protein GO986_12565 [Deinococcus sp. HMF7620]|uniref:Uncharacterized protein n=1 Tax=Deinococcus arboris TaxID=2682977 RepID=A0A7C9M9E4_9DEIO|nr:hypothetical protein [Deinococcus arboris]MVN87599.1 hypothetical protein [Deinococcus arboris]
MTKTAGRPKQKPMRVTVTLDPQHAEALKLMADEVGVKMAAFCANVLERYSLQDRQVMTSDLVRTLFEAQGVQLQEGLRAEIHAQMNRVRHLLARSALESMAVRNETGILLLKEFGKEKAQKYKEQAWGHAVHTLKEPTPAMRAALNELATGMGNDDPGLLMKVRASADQVTHQLAQVQQLTKQVALLQQQQQEVTTVLATMQQQLKATQSVVVKAVNKLEDTEEELRTKRKGIFGL